MCMNEKCTNEVNSIHDHESLSELRINEGLSLSYKVQFTLGAGIIKVGVVTIDNLPVVYWHKV